MLRPTIKGGYQYENCPKCKGFLPMSSKYEYSHDLDMKVLRLYCQRCNTMVRQTLLKT